MFEHQNLRCTDVSCVSSQWCFRSLASADAQTVSSSTGQEGDSTAMKLAKIQLKEEMTLELHTYP